MDLPEPTDDPRHYPDCCLSISTKLLDVLTDTFTTAVSDADSETGVRTLRSGSKPGLILSIGSGSGLLEALLLSRWSPSLRPPPSLSSSSSSAPGLPLRIEGVEIRASPSVNRYLPDPGNLATARGSWEVVSRRAPRRRCRGGARGLMFVYPRSPSLVGRYVGEFTASGSISGGGDGDGTAEENYDGDEEMGREGDDHQHRGESESEEEEEEEERELRVVVWVGHRSDWADFQSCFTGVPGFGAVEVVAGADAGLVEYEMMAVLRREILRG